MKSSDKLQEFKKLDNEKLLAKVKDLRKELFDLRFKQATRQLNNTHQFGIIKKQIAQLLTLSKSQSHKND